MSPRLTPRTDDRGATAVEYALYIFLVGLAVIVGLTALQFSVGAALGAVAQDPLVTGEHVTPVGGGGDEDEDDGDGEGSDHDEDDHDGEEGGFAQPDAPRNVTAVRAASGKIRVSWLAPQNSGTNAVTKYSVQLETVSAVTACNSSVTGWNDGSATVNAPTTSVTMDKLDKRTYYCVRVSAQNGITSGTTNYAYAGPVSAA